MALRRDCRSPRSGIQEAQLGKPTLLGIQRVLKRFGARLVRADVNEALPHDQPALGSILTP
jgi:hypothetical protein